MRARSAFVASAAAALFLAGFGGSAQAQDSGGEAKVKCEGVNSCKGRSDCKTAQSACKGKNSCHGKGFLMMTQAECDAARAEAAEQE